MSALGLETSASIVTVEPSVEVAPEAGLRMRMLGGWLVGCGIGCGAGGLVPTAPGVPPGSLRWLEFPPPPQAGRRRAAANPAIHRII
jgi:hypothetical protein